MEALKRMSFKAGLDWRLLYKERQKKQRLKREGKRDLKTTKEGR